MHLLVADRGHGGEHHEQGIDEVPAEEDHVADHPVAKDQREDQQRELEAL